MITRPLHKSCVLKLRSAHYNIHIIRNILRIFYLQSVVFKKNSGDYPYLNGHTWLNNLEYKLWLSFFKLPT